jgi:hypothetical protein
MFFNLQDSAREKDNPGEAAPKTEKTAICPGVCFSFRKKQEDLEIFQRNNPFVPARAEVYEPFSVLCFSLTGIMPQKYNFILVNPRLCRGQRV